MKVTSKVPGFTGVVAGVTFADGKASTTDQTAINYFRRHEYTLEAGKKPQKGKQAEKDTKSANTDDAAQSAEADSAEKTPAEPSDGKGATE